MKKPLLILSYLLVLCISSKVSALNNLDIVNNPGCSFLLLTQEPCSFNCLPGTSLTASVSQSIGATVKLSGAPPIVNKICITDFVVAELGDFMMCASDNHLKSVAACCPSDASILLTPIPQQVTQSLP